MTGQAASRTILSIRSERVLGAFAQPDERDVGSFSGGHGADVGDVDLARDDLVAQGDDDRGHQGEAVLALVGDQDAQMLGLTAAHRGSLHLQSSPRKTPLDRPFESLGRRYTQALNPRHGKPPTPARRVTSRRVVSVHGARVCAMHLLTGPTSGYAGAQESRVKRVREHERERGGDERGDADDAVAECRRVVAVR